MLPTDTEREIVQAIVGKAWMHCDRLGGRCNCQAAVHARCWLFRSDVLPLPRDDEAPAG